MIPRYILSTYLYTIQSMQIVLFTHYSKIEAQPSSRHAVAASMYIVHLYVPQHSLLVLSSRRRSSRMSVLDYHAPVFHITTASSTICRRRTTSERRSIYVYIVYIYTYIQYIHIHTQYGLSRGRESEPRVEAHNMASSTFSRGPTASHYYSGHYGPQLYYIQRIKVCGNVSLL